jgi:phosphoribosylglycinamide formyltransferase 1
MKKIALFASGNGSNAINIYNYFLDHTGIQATMLICNKENAGVWDKFENSPIEKILISKSDLTSREFIQKLATIDFLVLAGFLLLIPKELIAMFPNRIINIHPSLLPNFGGKGMYGHHVHQAVLDAKEQETGITIHLVNEEFDKGEILFQAQVPLSSHETIESISQKIHSLEQDSYPKVIENYITKFDC